MGLFGLILIQRLQCGPSRTVLTKHTGPCHGRVCESQSSEVGKSCVCVWLCVCGSVCGCLLGVLGGDSDGRAGNVPEGDGVGHLDGDAGGKCTDLLMYVHEKGV